MCAVKSPPKLAANAVDPSVLESLRELGGEDDPDFLAELLKKFLEHADRAVAELRAAVAINAHDRVRAIAHGLKGSAGNVGANPLAALATRIEVTAKTTTGPIPSADVDAIEREVARVRTRLASELE